MSRRRWSSVTTLLGIVVLGGVAFGADFSGVQKPDAKTRTAGKCPVGQSSCPNKSGKETECVALMVDRNNCGSCGKVCRQNEKCSGSKCVPDLECPSGQTACAVSGGKAKCSDHKRDLQNCGGCGKRCKGEYEKCVEGECVLDFQCAAGKTACASNAGKPACADFKRDAAHCGACAKVCKGERKKCVDGECILDFKCPTGKTACEGSSSGSKPTCSDFKRDPLNCGACGKTCNRAGERCVEGECIVDLKCPAGKTACAGSRAAAVSAASGREQAMCADLSTDRANCGACGNACKGTDKCFSGSCRACPKGQSQCQGGGGKVLPCSDHQTDRDNCGACGKVCPKSQSCVAGACK